MLERVLAAIGVKPARRRGEGMEFESLRDFVAGAKMLREAGYDRVARFAGRQVRFEPLDAAVPALG